GLAERDPTADELAREESVSVQFHVDLRTLAERTEADGLRVRPDTRPVVEDEDLRAPGGVGPEGHVEPGRQDVLHVRVAARVRWETVQRDLKSEREPERPRRERPFASERQSPLHPGPVRRLRPDRARVQWPSSGT